jgi:histidinol-phosphate aminotransferase
MEGKVDLSLSENLYGPATRCLEVLRTYGNLERYKRKSDLIAKLSEMFDVGEEYIFTGSGGHGVLRAIFNSKRGERLLLPEYSWRMFDVFAEDDRYEVDLFGQGKDFAYEHEKIIETNERVKPDITLICSPNNPTGNSIETDDLVMVLENVHGLVVLDEIYVNFSEKPERESIGLAKEYPNLVIVRSFSKGYALADLKMGYGVCGEVVKKFLGYHPNLPLNIRGLDGEIAVAALESQEYYEDVWNRIKDDRRILTEEFNEIPGCKAYPSEANFVLASITEGVKPVLKKKLGERGYKIKFFDPDKEPKFPNFIRFGVGREEHTKDLIGIFNEIKTGFI